MTDDRTGNDSDATPADGYDVLARRADDIDGVETPWGDNPFQAHYSWPATRALLPDLDGKRVLDAGCGIGDHVGWLLAQGADVVGVDASEDALGTARDRFGDRSTFRRVDLAEPLGALGEDAFDVVLSHLVLDHVEDWEPAFEAFHRALVPDGVLVFATVHPIRQYLEYDEIPSYYETTAVEVPWPDAPVTSYYRPPGAVLDPLLSAGFALEAFEEPKPGERYADRAPERHERAMERPEVLCVRTRAKPADRRWPADRG